jgi:hypothetical protein
MGPSLRWGATVPLGWVVSDYPNLAFTKARKSFSGRAP